MRLYVSGNSKNNVGYTPDVLTINNGDLQYNYDIQGEIGFEEDTLDCCAKGDLFIQVQDAENDVAIDEDYRDMTIEDYHLLKKLLQDPESEIIITIYPVDDSETDENLKKVETDRLTDCSAQLDYYIPNEDKIETVNFKFVTECYFE